MNFVIGLDADVFPLHPAWPGQPLTALWAYPAVSKRAEPGADVGMDTVQILLSLRRRIELLVSLHARGKQHTDLQHDVRDMAHL